ncbi:unnamed protein product [Parnassius apollo]|uniref:(apollo) hypothetical protein n=1 Tax=Parnassius apollo TaxID=110799 RepID=A0A8S3X0Q5_PARAO|nr:unnamed protein product [Parnassius apollo]
MVLITRPLSPTYSTTFENDRQPESKFPFSQVFVAPKDTGKHTEFVENQEVEPKTPIDRNTFHKFEIPVPDDLKEYAKVENAHKEFQKAIGAALVFVRRHLNVRDLAAPHHYAAGDALQKSNTKAAIVKKTEEAARQLESTKIYNKGRYMDEFSVREDLMGLAIGTHGANIRNSESCSC